MQCINSIINLINNKVDPSKRIKEAEAWKAGAVRKVCI